MLKRKVAIVGSRKRKDKRNIYKLVDSLDINEDTIISGGCRGVDTWAIEQANERNIHTTVFMPDIKPGLPYNEIVKCYYDRNERVAKECDIMYAFVSEDRKGGTENAIKWAKRYNKKVIIK